MYDISKRIRIFGTWSKLHENHPQNQQRPGKEHSGGRAILVCRTTSAQRRHLLFVTIFRVTVLWLWTAQEVVLEDWLNWSEFIHWLLWTDYKIRIASLWWLKTQHFPVLRGYFKKAQHLPGIEYWFLRTLARELFYLISLLIAQLLHKSGTITIAHLTIPQLSFLWIWLDELPIFHSVGWRFWRCLQISWLTQLNQSNSTAKFPLSVVNAPSLSATRHCHRHSLNPVFGNNAPE